MGTGIYNGKIFYGILEKNFGHSAGQFVLYWV